MIYSLLSISVIILMISYYNINNFHIFKKIILWSWKKNLPVECGFDPMSSFRLSFSTRFFLITIIFLIFDVEIILMLFTITIMNYMSISFSFFFQYFYFNI